MPPPAPRSFKPQSASVSVGLIDGATRSGRCTQFLPGSPDLILEIPAPSRGPDAVLRATLPAERIAWFAVHRAPGSEPWRSSGERVVRVHLAGGATFLVEARADDLHDPIGFYGRPDEPGSPYGELFFYAHAVVRRENPEPIGALLVQRGVLGRSALERGVEVQAEARGALLGQILVEQGRVSPEAVAEVASLQTGRRMRIGELLIEVGLTTEADIVAALAEQKRRHGRKLGEVLVAMGVVTEVDLAITLANKFSLPFVDLDDYSIDPAAIRAVPRELLLKYDVFPLEADAQGITFATADPLDPTRPLDAIRFAMTRRVREVMVTPSQLARFRKVITAGAEDDAFERILTELKAEASGPSADASPRRPDPASEVSESAVIRLVNQMIVDAYRRGASDIHVEPQGETRNAVLRLRIDGDCILYKEVPAQWRHALTSRLKIMANLDITERRKPQDGKICFTHQDKVIELRVACIPTVGGEEDIVMRLLAGSKPFALERLALSPRNLRELVRLSGRPHGLLLCVGPTGSGKTTTLHSVLGSINQPDTKIWTAEDPVEITQVGLRQVQVHPKIGFTFAAAMRAFLRADPDVIMVGEMRDMETALVAVEASLTGHLVLSTLHTNSAPETVTRLVDMGLDPFSFGDALLGVLAQRLARALCPSCRESYAGSPEEYALCAEALGADNLRARGIVPGPTFTLWRAKGCPSCGGTGFKGRVGLHELLVSNDALQHAIQHKASAEEIRAIAQEAGMTTLFQDGIEKCFMGVTELKQVTAVCSR